MSSAALSTSDSCRGLFRPFVRTTGSELPCERCQLGHQSREPSSSCAAKKCNGSWLLRESECALCAVAGAAKAETANALLTRTVRAGLAYRSRIVGTLL